MLIKILLRGINYTLLTKRRTYLGENKEHDVAGQIDSEVRDLLAKSFERMDAKRVFETPQSRAQVRHFLHR